MKISGDWNYSKHPGMWCRGREESILIRGDICLGFLKGYSVEFHLLTVFSVSEKYNPE